jgi:hypothetical protein
MFETPHLGIRLDALPVHARPELLEVAVLHGFDCARHGTLRLRRRRHSSLRHGKRLVRVSRVRCAAEASNELHSERFPTLL